MDKADQIKQVEEAIRGADRAGNKEDLKKLIAHYDELTGEAEKPATLGHQIGAFTDGLAQGLTLNTSDEIAAGLSTGFGYLGDYDEALRKERARMDENKQRAGWTRMAGEIPGAIASGIGTGGAGLAARGLGRAALTGAGYGAAAGAGAARGDIRERGREALDGAKVGAIAGPLGNVAGHVAARPLAAVGRQVSKVLPKVKMPGPTSGEWKSGSKTLYKQFEDNPALLKNEALVKFRDQVQQDLASKGYRKQNQKGVKEVLKGIDEEIKKGLPLTTVGAQSLDEMIAGGSRAMNPKNDAMIAKMRQRLKSVTADPENYAGDGRGVANLKAKADKAWNIHKTSEMLEDAFKQAARKTNRTGSGGNIHNNLLNAVDKILNNKTKSKFITPEVRGAMETFVNTGDPQNFRRLLGKLSPEGNGLIANLALYGGAATNPLTLAGPASGFFAKRASDKAARKGADELLDYVRRGGAPATMGPRKFLQNSVPQTTAGVVAGGEQYRKAHPMDEENASFIDWLR